MTEQFDVSVLSGKPRKATVYLPKAYDGKKRFPVLYMFDGQTAFFDERAPYGDSWRMGQILDELNAELIVAAVDCDEKNRLTEYSPFPFEHKNFRSEGKGGEYLAWLIDNFKPLIDRKYLTRPGRDGTKIAGSSMGGLMTVFALCERPDVFSGGAALSPSFWVDPEASAAMLKAASMNNIALYLDYGEAELDYHGDRQKKALSDCLKMLVEKKTEFTFRLIRGGEHNEKSWRKQVPTFLKILNLI